MVTLTTRQDRELRNLRLAFLALLPERVCAIEAALHDVVSTDGVDAERIEVLFHLAHRLCGSAGIYGHPGVHRAAGALECAADAERRSLAESPSSQLADLRRLVQALRAASAESPSAPVAAPKKATATRRRSRPRARRGASR